MIMCTRFGGSGLAEGLMDRNENVLAPLVGRIIRYGAVLSTVSWAFTLIWGFELRTLLGFAVGYGFMCAAMLYLSHTCERAVELDAAKAKRLMTRCYVLRYFALFAVCAAAMLTGLVNVVGVLVPQFYPRIVLTLIQIFSRKEGSHE